MRAIIDNVPSSIYLKDIDGRYLLVNKTFGDRHGVAPVEAIGKTVYDLVPAQLADNFTNHDHEVIRTRSVVERETRGNRPDGTSVYLTVKFPFLDSDGEIVTIGGITTDITEHTKAGETLQKSED